MTAPAGSWHLWKAMTLPWCHPGTPRERGWCQPGGPLSGTNQGAEVFFLTLSPLPCPLWPVQNAPPPREGGEEDFTAWAQGWPQRGGQGSQQVGAHAGHKVRSPCKALVSGSLLYAALGSGRGPGVPAPQQWTWRGYWEKWAECACVCVCDVGVTWSFSSLPALGKAAASPNHSGSCCKPHV